MFSGRKIAVMEHPLVAWLAEQKVKTGLTQEKFAPQVGVTLAFLNAHMKGQYPNIKFEILDKFMELTGIPYDNFAKYLRWRIEEQKKEKEEREAYGLDQKKDSGISLDLE